MVSRAREPLTYHVEEENTLGFGKGAHDGLALEIIEGVKKSATSFPSEVL